MPALQLLSGVRNHHPARMTVSGCIGTFYYHYISNTIGENKKDQLKKDDLRGGEET